MKLVEGRTYLEARSGEKVQFQVNCQQLTMQAPDGTIQAQGDVKVTGLDLKGTCDLLTITWHDESVQLAGKVHLNGQEIELTAEKLNLKSTPGKTVKKQLGPEGLVPAAGWFPF